MLFCPTAFYTILFYSVILFLNFNRISLLLRYHQFFYLDSLPCSLFFLLSTLSLVHDHSFFYFLSHTHSLSFSHTLSQSHTHSLTHTHILSLTHTFSHSHTHSLHSSLSISIPILSSYCLIMPHYITVYTAKIRR